MSKLSKVNKDQREVNELQLGKAVTNFMGGDSYTVNPLDTLKMVSASSIFGEPSYYRDSKISGDSYLNRTKKAKYADSIYDNDLRRLFDEMCLSFDGDDQSTEDVMTKAIDAALDYDFEGTLEWAVELRNNFFMRLNPQVIYARAAMHPKRQEFTEKSPAGKFRDFGAEIMQRPDDVMSGISYYMYANGGKAKMPSVLKRAYADKLGKLNRYQVAKYKNHDIGMIDATRIVHACSPVLSELIKTGTVEVEDNEKTWENLRSAGMSWEEVFKTVNMGHMALLRNLRNFFSEVTDNSLRKEYLDKLKAGVVSGKQFPYRYYSAYKAISSANIKNPTMALDTLEECIDLSLANVPMLKGNTVILSDNSGSAWGTFNSEYGSMTVAEIDNLSAVITAACSEYGVVVKFGNTTRVFEISKRNGILKQAQEISADHDEDVGGATEGGIWEFFDQAIYKNEHWDNIFIYSDMQAGHGGLYGTTAQRLKYQNEYCVGGNIVGYINVFKLILDYRKKVNKRVNVFSVQTAGYDNNVVPDYAYRTNLMYGWTGKEAVFADLMIHLWDEVESQNKKA